LMAQLLFSQPEILLLDEPTNHLDLYAITWLAGYLLRYGGLLIVVSHDRIFLDEVCTDMIDVDYGTLKVYNGNYESFLAAKTQAREQKAKELERQDKLREDTQRFIDRFRAKATKASAVQSRIKMLDKLDRVELQPSSRRYPHFGFEVREKSGAVPLKIKEVSKAFGALPVLSQVSFEVQRGDKIALIGPNGVGKSTLLKIIMGELAADQGKVAWGHGAVAGYFPQDYRQILPPEQSLYHWLSGFAGDQPEARVRGLLGRMLFEGNSVHHKISTLSGGEATRLVFAMLMLKQDNLLILDEPTNHLDMEAIDMLAQALQAYTGTLIFVSHNRYFVSLLATRILELQPEGLQDFKGSYGEYLERANVDHLDRSQLPRQTALTLNQAKQQQQVGYEARKNQQRRLRSLERRIPEIEERCQQLEHAIATNEAALAEAYSSGAAVEALLAKQQALQQELDQRFAEWEATEEEYQTLLQEE
ncbi:MAG: ABC-F family ATP-binding cassette domain-containing protein, partial [Candidatus Sericytochromatia bacterium]